MGDIVRVGIGSIILDNNKVLLGQRLGSHGENQWAFPGGHLEFGETPEECAIRETFEETGLVINNVLRGPWTNDFFEAENKHYITLFMVARYMGGEVVLKEPHRCKEWKWHSFHSLPKPLFLTIQNMLKLGYDAEYYRGLLEQTIEA